MRWLKSQLIPMAVVLATGCSTTRLAIRGVGPVMQGTLESVNEEPSLDMAARAIPGQLKLLEGMLKKDPENRELLFLAAQGFGSYAFGFVEDSNPQDARSFYARGQAYGLRLLRQNKNFAAAEPDAESFTRSLESFGPKDAPALFWTAYNWSGYLRMSLQMPEAVADLPKVERLLDRVLELDAAYFHGSPHILVGALAGSRSKFLGGDPEKAKKHFEEQIRLAPDFLFGKLLYARFYAVQVQDRALFQKLLKEILAFPGSTDPSLTLANNIAKVKAKRLLDDTDEYF